MRALSTWSEKNKNALIYLTAELRYKYKEKFMRDLQMKRIRRHEVTRQAIINDVTHIELILCDELYQMSVSASDFQYSN